VDQNLLQGFAVGVDRSHILRQVEMHRNIFLAYLAAGIGHGVVDDQVQIDRLRFEYVQARFRAW